MRKIVEEIIEGFFDNSKEMFQNGGYDSPLHKFTNNPKQNMLLMTNKHPIAVFISFFIIELLVLLIGKYLWNNIVVDIISIARPIKNIWQILGLSILIKLLTN